MLAEAATRSVPLVMVMDFLVEDLIRAERLVRVLCDFEMSPVSVNVVYIPKHHPTLAARVLIYMLRGWLQV